MKKTSNTIVFFGSGPVAAESLQLLAEYSEIEAVITKPRPEHHKGPVPVLELAEKLGLPVFTVTNKRSLDALFATKPVVSKLAVLIDFGIIVSQKVIDYFPLGIINSHFSLLPEWRGADPITFSILSGQKQTGISLMMLVAGMDEGPLLAQAPYDLPDDVTTPQLTEDLIDLSDKTLQKIIPLWFEGAIVAAPQIQASIARADEASYSRKLRKEDSDMDWEKPAELLEREVRGFIEWPKSRTTIGKLELVITKAHVIDEKGVPGMTAVIDKLPVIFCHEGALAIDKLKPAGKKEMTGEAFIAGYKDLFLRRSSN